MSEAMDSARQTDINGFVEIKDNPISMVGVFPYRGNQIGAPDPDKIYMVYRPAEELSTDECIESFKLLPWTDEHPTSILSGDGTGIAPESKGVHGIIGECVRFDGERLLGNIKAFSVAIGDLIKSGKKQLSAGYRCAYDFTSGVYNGVTYDAVQRNIRGNHLALVGEGRCGPDVAVLDSAITDTMVFTLDTKELLKMADEEVMVEEVKDESMTLEQVAEQVKALMPVLAMVEELKAALEGKAEVVEEVVEVTDEDKDEDEYSAMDAAIKSLKAEVASLKKGAFKAVIGEVSRRDVLARDLSAHVGTFDSAEMDAQEVAAYGVKKLGLECEKGQEISAIKGFLSAQKTSKAVAMDAKPSSQIDEYLKGGK